MLGGHVINRGALARGDLGLVRTDSPQPLSGFDRRCPERSACRLCPRSQDMPVDNLGALFALIGRTGCV